MDHHPAPVVPYFEVVRFRGKIVEPIRTLVVDEDHCCPGTSSYGLGTCVERRVESSGRCDENEVDPSFDNGRVVFLADGVGHSGPVCRLQIADKSRPPVSDHRHVDSAVRHCVCQQQSMVTVPEYAIPETE